MNVRQNVFELGSDWADPILWYARGVAEMQKLTLDQPTSWAFYAAMHGMEVDLWGEHGLPTSPLPTVPVQKIFWEQCQHQSWYFLPWHRGYLLAFEANVRAQIVKLGGLATWALPYWNYFKNSTNGKAPLPPEFASKDWPDGTGNNPLFVEQRYGPNGNGKVIIPLRSINLKAMGGHDFTGVNTANPGFAGPDTLFQHSGDISGGIEDQPHNMLHSLVGGEDESTGNEGLMSDPELAGYDPIFWLHHANIDRLWQVWRQNPASNVNSTDPNWLNGPSSRGDRAFAMPMPDGTTWNYVPSQMEDLTTLGTPMTIWPPRLWHQVPP